MLLCSMCHIVQYIHGEDTEEIIESR